MSELINWKRVWYPPRTDSLGELSARDKWKSESSRHRYLQRDDAMSDTVGVLTGEIGKYEGIRFISSCQS